MAMPNNVKLALAVVAGTVLGGGVVIAVGEVKKRKSASPTAITTTAAK